MSKRIDLTGQRFGRLAVIQAAGNDSNQKALWLCQCDCDGKFILTRSNDLRRGKSCSCGCLKGRKITHGHTRRGKLSPTYETWKSMMRRCYNPNATDYAYYGGRDIGVFNSWHDFQTFLTHLLATIGLRPPGMTLDRIDNDRDYEPGNIRWADWPTQAGNRRPRRPHWRIQHGRRVFVKGNRS